MPGLLGHENHSQPVVQDLIREVAERVGRGRVPTSVPIHTPAVEVHMPPMTPAARRDGDGKADEKMDEERPKT